MFKFGYQPSMTHTIEGSSDVLDNHQGAAASIQSIVPRLEEKKIRGGDTSPEAELFREMQMVIFEKICYLLTNYPRKHLADHRDE